MDDFLEYYLERKHQEESMMTDSKPSTLNRRDFIKGSVGLVFVSRLGPLSSGKRTKKAVVALVKAQDRKEATREVCRLFGLPSLHNKKVMIKPNFNTADPCPGSTHNDTLQQLVTEVRKGGASEITVGERSGPPSTKSVLESKKVFDLARELNFQIINFEDLEDPDWIPFNPPGNHWKDGFALPRPAVETDVIVSTCCLKTHQYGGVFTLSLKLSVGFTPKKLMRELHRSLDMRKMIAEINVGYAPQLIILDGIEAFVDGGPMTGQKKISNVFLAGKDRVAVDAAGIAILKDLGSNEAIMGEKIFEQEQIARAAELGLGVSGPDQIEFITPDQESRQYAEKLRKIMAEG